MTTTNAAFKLCWAMGVVTFYFFQNFNVFGHFRIFRAKNLTIFVGIDPKCMSFAPVHDNFQFTFELFISQIPKDKP